MSDISGFKRIVRITVTEVSTRPLEEERPLAEAMIGGQVFHSEVIVAKQAVLRTRPEVFDRMITSHAERMVREVTDQMREWAARVREEAG